MKVTIFVGFSLESQDVCRPIECKRKYLRNIKNRNFHELVEKEKVYDKRKKILYFYLR